MNGRTTLNITRLCNLDVVVTVKRRVKKMAADLKIEERNWMHM